MKFKAAVFDLDGTLLDTLEDIADSSNRVLEAVQFPTHPVEAYRYFVGDGIMTLIKRILPEQARDEETISRTVEAFRKDYAVSWNIKSRMYDGIAEMLDGLRDTGLRLAILSNKPDRFTRICVNELLGRWDFDPLFGHREGVPKKPDPAGAFEIATLLELDPSEILYLGDTSVDMKTATSAGMFPVGALWGFRTAEELKESGARYLASDPREVIELVR
ncbi:MAG: HAD-IA family hydrolase [Desulfobulbaceae bacterium]|nr:HAD-IA family hydrolase [Desulfobulbaceae bacterium]